MTDVDAIARLLDVGFNAVFLFLLWRVYQDFIRAIEAHRAYMEKLVDKLLVDQDDAPMLPVPPARYQTPQQPYVSRTPTELRDIDRVNGGD